MLGLALQPSTSTGEERDRAARRPDQGAAVGAGQGQQPHRAPQVAERATRTHPAGQLI